MAVEHSRKDTIAKSCTECGKDRLRLSSGFQMSLVMVATKREFNNNPSPAHAQYIHKIQ